MSSASYRLLGAGGAVLEACDGDVTLRDGVLEVRPAAGATLRVPSSRIAAVGEPAPFAVLVTLADGTAVELSRLGRMRTQLLGELRDAQAALAAAESGAVGDAARFTGLAGGVAADLHVFEDALLVLADGQSRRLPFSFVTDVQARDYVVAVALAGQDPLLVSRLGRRTDEFTRLLGERLAQARTRTSAFLGSLLPGLDPMALRAAAGLLRDGVAVPAASLDAVHPDLAATLVRVATLPGRLAGLAALAGQAQLAPGVAIGFKQVASVRRAAVGATPWTDPSAPPHIGEHETPGGRFGTGFGGMLGAGAMSGLGSGGGYGGGGYGGYGGPFGGGPGGFGPLGGYWAFRALGGMSGTPGGAHSPAAVRAEPRYHTLIPETEDLGALSTVGDDPTVLAFALLTPRRGGDLVAYVALNRPEPASYVYRGAGPDPRALVNQALDAVGFAAAEVHAAAAGDPTAAHRQDVAGSPLPRALVAAVAHDDGWAARLTELLAPDRTVLA